MVFTWGRDGRPLGEAYVEFPTEEAQQEAMGRDRERMGSRYIEIFKATKADLAAVSPLTFSCSIRCLLKDMLLPLAMMQQSIS